jgi:DNA polymerase III alpha subunit
MGFYAPHTLVDDARRHGVEVAAVDINASTWMCQLEPKPTAPAPDDEDAFLPLPLKGRGSGRGETVVLPLPATRGEGRGEGLHEAAEAGDEDPAPLTPALSPFHRERGTTPRGEQGIMLRLGFELVRGLREESARRIEAARLDGPFLSVADVARRTRIPRHELTRLALAGALNSLCFNRRNALWDLHALGPFDEDDLFFGLPMVADRADFPSMSPAERVAADFETVSLSLESHPVGLLRPQLKKLGAVTSSKLLEIPSSRIAKIGGLVIVRQRPPTAKGFTFLSMEDEDGIANVIIEPSLFEKYRREITATPLLIATGRVERSGKVVNLKVTHLAALVPDLPVEPHVHHFR